MDHLAHLSVEARRFEAALRATDLDAPVAACGGWLLRDLALHLGGIHRWATDVVRTGQAVPPTPEAVPDEDLGDWFAAGATRLAETLRDVGDKPCWTLDGSGTTAFWRRRQALETAVHRVDAERCAGTEQPLPDDLAADGVTEVLEVLLPRQVRLGRTTLPARGVHLHAPGGPTWQLGDAPPQATVTASAPDLLLLLWHRRNPADPGVDVEGDPRALHEALSLQLTP